MARPLLPYFSVFVMFAGASAWSDNNITFIVDDQAALIQFPKAELVSDHKGEKIAGIVMVSLAVVFRLLIPCRKIKCDNIDGDLRYLGGGSDKYETWYNKHIEPKRFYFSVKKVPHNSRDLKETCEKVNNFNGNLGYLDLIIGIAGIACTIAGFTSSEGLLQLVSDDFSVSDAAELVLGVLRGHGDALPFDRHGATQRRERSVEAFKNVLGGSFGDQLTSRAQKIAALVPDALKERAVDLAHGAQSASMPIEPGLKSRTVALLQDWSKFGTIHEGLVRAIAGNLSSFPAWRDHYKDFPIASNLPSTVSTSFAAGYRIGKGIERL